MRKGCRTFGSLRHSTSLRDPECPSRFAASSRRDDLQGGSGSRGLASGSLGSLKCKARVAIETTSVTSLMVFLIPDTIAIHLKLNEIVAAT